jgi:osmotically-inducible protein OsmY
MQATSVVASAVAALLLAGCASEQTQARQTPPVPLDDHSIVQRIHDSFNTNRYYPYAGVLVTATNGNVQLTGYVEHVWQKYNASAIASDISGVKAVSNHIIALNDNLPTTASSEARE